MSTNQVVNNPFYQPMFDMAARAGVGVKAHFAYQLLNLLVNINNKELRSCIGCLKVKCKEYGCTIMLDGWTTLTKKTLVNFLVYCDGITAFICLVSINGEAQDYTVIQRHLRRVI